MIDPSLVDAHVGKALFTDAILGALRASGKTVILVTHALHFLPQCDYIYTLENGYIAAQGKYQDLIESNETFASLMQQFGGQEKREEEEEEEEKAVEGAVKLRADIDEAKLKSDAKTRLGAGTGKLEGRLIVAEKRSTGSVSGKGVLVARRVCFVDIDPLSSLWGLFVGRKGLVDPPVHHCVHVSHARESNFELLHVSVVAGEVRFLLFIPFVFVNPGAAHSIVRTPSIRFCTRLWAYLSPRSPCSCESCYPSLPSWKLTHDLSGIAMDYMGFFVSQNLHHDAIKHIFYAPMSFFDTTVSPLSC